MGAPRVEIDPNVRVRGNRTVGFAEDFDCDFADVHPGQAARVYESESGLEGDATVALVHVQALAVLLDVGWPSLRPAPEFDEFDTTEAEFDRMWAEGEPVELRED